MPASKKVTLVTKEDLAFLRKVKSFSKDPKLINFAVDNSPVEYELDETQSTIEDYATESVAFSSLSGILDMPVEDMRK